MTRKNIGLVSIVAGLISVLAAVFVGLRPVTNVWGQECGSLLSPQKLVPLTELSRAIEEAAFQTACPNALSPFSGWAIGLAVLAVFLFAVGTYLQLARTNGPSITRSAPQNRQLAEELERVNVLYNSGALTHQEFVAAKSKLLSQQNDPQT